MSVIEREWLDRVTAVVDECHAENLGGEHRSGFCKACAYAHLVAQRAVPHNPEGVVAENERLRAAINRYLDATGYTPVPPWARLAADELRTALGDPGACHDPS